MQSYTINFFWWIRRGGRWKRLFVVLFVRNLGQVFRGYTRMPRSKSEFNIDYGHDHILTKRLQVFCKRYILEKLQFN